MLLYKQKKNQSVGKDNRFLISINVLVSVGLIRFIVNKDELAATVIDTTLKSYACEGRLPILDSNLNNFLYCSNAESDTIEVGVERRAGMPRKGSGSWKVWTNKSLNLKISSH
ncbi:hypothetical protein AAG906_013314 [Vitis piasezkii]